MPRSLPLVVALALAVAVSVALLLRGRERALAPAPAQEADAAPAEREAVSLEPATDAMPAATVTGRESPVPADVAELDESSAAPPLAAAQHVATLAVLVVDATRGAPLAAVRLRVGARPSGRASWSHVEGSRGTLETSPLTDADGRAEFDLPAGVELQLYGGDGDAQARGEVEIPALAAGERREVVLVLETGEDVVYFGRVVAEDGKLPIAGASVELVLARSGFRSVDGGESVEHHEEDVLAQQETGADGLFRLSIASWSGPILRVTAPGFTPAFVEIGRDHDTPDTARVVPLRRDAALVVRLVDALGAPARDVAVRLRTDAYGLGLEDHGGVFLPSLADPEWERRADASGACTFEGLPSLVPLDVEIAIAGRVAIAGLPELRLEPGETREVEWRVGGGCKLEGRVVDQHGEPVSRLELWLQPAQAHVATYLDSYNGREARTTTRTRADGRFAFPDVGAGKWWLGPAAVREDWDPPLSDEVAPFAQVVEVPDGSGRLELEVLAHRGLYVRGRVLDPAGVPASDCFVTGFLEASLMPMSTQTDELGAFVLGPLGPGRHVLTANAFRGGDSEPVEALAGDEGVELRVRSAGSVRGAVVDGTTGARCAAEIEVRPEDAPELCHMSRSKADGTFHFEGVPPGACTVVARASSNRIGVLRGVEITAERESPELVVTVVAGASVRLRNAGSRWLRYRLTCDGAVVMSDGLPAGTVAGVVVPAGPVRVECESQEGPLEPIEVELAAGEERELVLDDG